MTPRKAWIAGLVGAAFVSPTMVRAQVAAIPPALETGPAAAAAGGGLGGASALGGAAAAPSIFSFLGISKANCDACKAHICSSPIGQLLNNGLTGPIGSITGGLIPPLCPTTPSASDLAALAAKSGPMGAETVAAKIKQDEADAAARVAAVEYLGTVDCRHWKEAKIALLNALRGDRNECVRWAAARALNSGCCCSKETIEKLKIVVTGDDSDGFPAELSPRVKGAAFAALQNCLAQVTEVVPTTPPVTPVPPEQPTTPPPVRPEGTPTAHDAADATHIAAGHTVTSPRAVSFEDKLAQKSMAQVVDEARQVVIAASSNPPRLRILPTGKRSVFHALAKARMDTAAPAAAPDPNVNMAPAPTPSPEPMNLTPVQPAAPDPNMSPGQGVVPTSFVVPAGPDGASPGPDRAAQAESRPQPLSTGKRSLADILSRSRGRDSGQ